MKKETTTQKNIHRARQRQARKGGKHVMKTKRHSKLYQFKPIRCPQDVQWIIDLLDGHMHLSDWSKMNDILEGVYRIVGNGDEAGMQSVFQAKQGYGVACFCGSYRRNGSDVLKKHLMWSHYASCHTGVAIEFEAPKTEGNGWFLAKMQYGDGLKTKTAEELNRNLYDEDNNKRDELAKELLTYKLKEWKYEQEWRLLVDRALLDENGCLKVQVGGSGDTSVPFNITKVYLGSRFHRNPAGKSQAVCQTNSLCNGLAGTLDSLLQKCKDVGVRYFDVADKFPDNFLTKEDYKVIDKIQANEWA